MSYKAGDHENENILTVKTRLRYRGVLQGDFEEAAATDENRKTIPYSEGEGFPTRGDMYAAFQGRQGGGTSHLTRGKKKGGRAVNTTQRRK